MEFKLPPKKYTSENQFRRAGFEIELAGLSFGDISDSVTEIFGGKPAKQNSFLYKIKDSRFGDFTVELDSAVLKTKAYERYFEELGIDVGMITDDKKLDELIFKVASSVIPFEVVTPPVPFNKLDMVEELNEALRDRGAKGTGSSIFYAFGLHINPELPDITPRTLLFYMKAFALMYGWLYKHSEIDFTRKVVPFINEFPAEYLELVADPEYLPDADRFIEDYLFFNPTRNRPLDLVPALGMLNMEKTVALYPERGKTNFRPALHYRLPNCRVDNPDWSIATEWNRWVQLEKLALNEHEIKKLGYEYREASGRPFGMINWNDRINEWLRDE